MDKTTIITMFFNIKKLKDSSESTRPIDFYFENSVDVLKLNYPMVIFCDEDTYNPIKNIRNSHLQNNKTVYIVKDFDSYEYYQNCWNIISNNRIKRGEPLDKRNTVSYLLMGMFKPYAFNFVHNKNFFNTEYYAWIDVGCKHIVNELSTYAPLMLNNPNSKVSVCYIHYRKHEELCNMQEYMKYGGPCGIASTAYTVEASYVHKYYTSMFSIFYEHLYNEVGHTDETVLTYCYNKYPDMFTIYGGDYYSVFVNYHKPTQDINVIVNCFIKNAIEDNKIDLCKNMAIKILVNNDNLDQSIKDYLMLIMNM